MKPRKLSVQGRAAKLLALREHTRTELARKLKFDVESDSELARLLDGLEARGYLSDRRFAEGLIDTKKNKFGPIKLAHELRQRGVGEEIIEPLVRGLRQDELQVAKAVWIKKFGQAPRDAKEKAKQIRFLQSRGFSLETIGKLLRFEEE